MLFFPEISSLRHKPILSALGLLGRLILGGAFLWAGVAKATHPGLFLLDVRSFQLLPDPWAAWLAMGLPWLEIFSAVAVIFGPLRWGGLLVIQSSLVIFIAAILWSWHRGLEISCGCFGKSDEQSVQSAYVDILLRDGLLLSVGALLGWIWWRLGREHPPRPLDLAGPADEIQTA